MLNVSFMSYGILFLPATDPKSQQVFITVVGIHYTKRELFCPTVSDGGAGMISA
jgi:hypothetical protein